MSNNDPSFFSRYARTIWKVVAVLAFISFLLVTIQIWYEPFKDNFIWKLVMTWTAFVVMIFAIRLAEDLLKKDDAKPPKK